MSKLLPVLVVAGGVAASAPLSAAVIELRPSADAGLHSSFPDRNYGAAGDFIVGTLNNGSPNRAVLAFDIAGGVPAGATINSVSLALSDQSNNTVVASNFGLHRMLKDWDEGGGAGIVNAADGEVTWNSQAQAGALWAAPGGRAGEDFQAAASGTYNTGAGGFVFASAPGLVGDVQSWVDSPASNYGWIMVSDAEGTQRTARRLGSREDGAGSPVLTIDYTPVPEPAQVAGAATMLLGYGIYRRHKAFRAGAGLTRRCRNLM